MNLLNNIYININMNIKIKNNQQLLYLLKEDIKYILRNIFMNKVLKFKNLMIINLNFLIHMQLNLMNKNVLLLILNHLKIVLKENKLNNLLKETQKNNIQLFRIEII